MPNRIGPDYHDDRRRVAGDLPTGEPPSPRRAPAAAALVENPLVVLEPDLLAGLRVAPSEGRVLAVDIEIGCLLARRLVSTEESDLDGVQ
jgi:hypothetical protein